jgi:hypothetical protein
LVTVSKYMTAYPYGTSCPLGCSEGGGDEKENINL